MSLVSQLIWYVYPPLLTGTRFAGEWFGAKADLGNVWAWILWFKVRASILHSFGLCFNSIYLEYTNFTVLDGVFLYCDIEILLIFFNNIRYLSFCSYQLFWWNQWVLFFVFVLMLPSFLPLGYRELHAKIQNLIFSFVYLC